ncbi:MAG TPA: aldo/keto reductase [Devosiaceae bacterium]|nr:aldo/keto reductase [Devosiaceae bacterium]
MAQQPRLKLNDGTTIPQLGFGVWQVPPETTADIVGEALRTGYVSIDTAEGYRNERGVGDAVQNGDIGRDQLYITSKLRNGAHGYDDAMRAFDQTMAELQLDVLDLFLIHWPLPKQGKYLEAWKALVEMQKSGRVRSIGVSNFNPDHLERIIGETGVVPAVNQIELHPTFQQRAARDFHARHNIVIESWSPLGQGQDLNDPGIAEIARKHGKTPAQVIIRWHLDQGLVVIPKSVTPSRIRENFAVLDFKLDAEDLQRIAALDDPKGRIGSDPAVADHRF